MGKKHASQYANFGWLLILYHRQNYFSLQHKISNFHFIQIEIKRKITVNQFKYLILQALLCYNKI